MIATAPSPVLPFLTPEQWRIDLAQVSDVSFVVDSWCSDENLKTARPSGMHPDVFKVGQRKRILSLLERCKVAVVRPTAAYFSTHGKEPNPRELFGWVCYTLDRATLRPIIHFVYVKAGFRNHGLADSLLHTAGVRPERGAWCTHTRLHLRKALENRGVLYNPFLLDYDPAALPPKKDPYR